DAGGGVPGEHHAALGVEGPGGLDQRGHAGGGQVVARDVRRDAAHRLADQVAHERQVAGDQLVARVRGRRDWGAGRGVGEGVDGGDTGGGNDRDRAHDIDSWGSAAAVPESAAETARSSGRSEPVRQPGIVRPGYAGAPCGVARRTALLAGVPADCEEVENLSLVLWRERELLETLQCCLEQEQLVLTNDRTRWLARVAREVEEVLTELRETELLRSVAADAVARSHGLPSNP